MRPNAYIDTQATGDQARVLQGAQQQERYLPIYPQRDYTPFIQGIIGLVCVLVVIGGIGWVVNAFIGSANYERCDKVGLCRTVVTAEIKDRRTERKFEHQERIAQLALDAIEDDDDRAQAAAITSAVLERPRTIFQPNISAQQIVRNDRGCTTCAPAPVRTTRCGASPCDRNASVQPALHVTQLPVCTEANVNRPKPEGNGWVPGINPNNNQCTWVHAGKVPVIIGGRTVFE